MSDEKDEYGYGVYRVNYQQEQQDELRKHYEFNHNENLKENSRIRDTVHRHGDSDFNGYSPNEGKDFIRFKFIVAFILAIGWISLTISLRNMLLESLIRSVSDAKQISSVLIVVYNAGLIFSGVSGLIILVTIYCISLKNLITTIIYSFLAIFITLLISFVISFALLFFR